MLFFSSAPRHAHNATLPREAVELMQRFDILAEACFYAPDQDPGGMWVGGLFGEQRMMRLLEKRRNVYLVQQIWNRIPRQARQKIAEAVSSGAGLVLVGDSASEVLEGGEPIEGLPHFIAPMTG